MDVWCALQDDHKIGWLAVMPYCIVFWALACPLPYLVRKVSITYGQKNRKEVLV